MKLRSVVALLFVASVLTSVTDMPGYYYVPGFYQLVLLVTIGAAWAFTVANSRRERAGPPSGTAA